MKLKNLIFTFDCIASIIIGIYLTKIGINITSTDTIRGHKGFDKKEARK